MSGSTSLDILSLLPVVFQDYLALWRKGVIMLALSCPLSFCSNCECDARVGDGPLRQ